MEIGNWKLEIGNWKWNMEIGKWKLESGKWKVEWHLSATVNLSVNPVGNIVIYSSYIMDCFFTVLGCELCTLHVSVLH